MHACPDLVTHTFSVCTLQYLSLNQMSNLLNYSITLKQFKKDYETRKCFLEKNTENANFVTGTNPTIIQLSPFERIKRGWHRLEKLHHAQFFIFSEESGFLVTYLFLLPYKVTVCNSICCYQISNASLRLGSWFNARLLDIMLNASNSWFSTMTFFVT